MLLSFSALLSCAEPKTVRTAENPRPAISDSKQKPQCLTSKQCSDAKDDSSDATEMDTDDGTTTLGEATKDQDAKPAVALDQYSLDVLNKYRLQAGLNPLIRDNGFLAQFAAAGSQEMAANDVPHTHFTRESAQLTPAGYCQSGENQGIGVNLPDLAYAPKIIDDLLKGMMSEGPGGGHYDHIVSPVFTVVGVHVMLQGGKLYLTHDFARRCN